MPEGPEVKIAANYYNDFFKNSSKIKFEPISKYYQEKYIDVFNQIEIHTKSFTPIYTIGKNLFINLNHKLIFNFHLGMTGGWSNTLVKHCHIKISNESKYLFFRDVRKFGKMKIITMDQSNAKFYKEHDLLNKDYNFNKHLDFLNKYVGDKKSICSILMNQTYFPGVGNYIKSEALYASKLHPEEKWRKISLKQRKNLIKQTKKIMKNSFISGGAELRDFKNPFHKSNFKLFVYGKDEDLNKNKISSMLTSDQRKTWFCPKTQKKL